MLCQASSGDRHKPANRITQVEALLKKIAETDRPQETLAHLGRCLDLHGQWWHSFRLIGLDQSPGNDAYWSTARKPPIFRHPRGADGKNNIATGQVDQQQTWLVAQATKRRKRVWSFVRRNSILASAQSCAASHAGHSFGKAD
jgi:hypothetical protein